MKKLFFILFFIPVICWGQSCPPFRIGSNPGFENALATNTKIGNWYGTQSAPQIGGKRLANTEMAGSYVGVVYDTSSINPETLSIDILADDVNVQPELTFDIRPKSFSAVFGNYAYLTWSGGSMFVTGYDTSGTLVTDDLSNFSTARWPLFGLNYYGDHQYEYRILSAAVDTTYTITINIYKMIMFSLLTSKTWSDVHTVRLTFTGQCLNSSVTIKYYIDNFR